MFYTTGELIYCSQCLSEMLRDLLETQIILMRKGNWWVHSRDHPRPHISLRMEKSTKWLPEWPQPWAHPATTLFLSWKQRSSTPLDLISNDFLPQPVVWMQDLVRHLPDWREGGRQVRGLGIVRGCPKEWIPLLSSPQPGISHTLVHIRIICKKPIFLVSLSFKKELIFKPAVDSEGTLWEPLLLVCKSQWVLCICVSVAFGDTKLSTVWLDGEGKT